MQLLYHDVLKDTGVGPTDLTPPGPQRFRLGAGQDMRPVRLSHSADITSLDGSRQRGNGRKLERNGLDKTA